MIERESGYLDVRDRCREFALRKIRFVPFIEKHSEVVYKRRLG